MIILNDSRDQLYYSSGYNSLLGAPDIIVNGPGSSFTKTARRAWDVSIVQSSFVYASNAFFPSLSMSSRQRISTLAKAAIRVVCQVHILASISTLPQQLGAKCGADHDEENVDVCVPVSAL